MKINISAVTQRSLRAVSRTRAAGLHYYGNLLGLTMRDRTMRMEPDPGSQGVTSIAAVATLADLALGSAVREQIEPGARLATVSLGLQHLTSSPAGALAATGSVVGGPVATDTGAVLAECSIRDDEGSLIAVGSGWFVQLAPPKGVELQPLRWDMPCLDQLTLPLSLSGAEAESVARTVDAALRVERLDRSTVVDELLALAWDDSRLSSGHARGRLEVGPHLANRVGHVQGGALYGSATVCAGRLVDPTAMGLANGHFQYLNPATGGLVEVEAELMKSGRRIAYVSCLLSSGGVPIAVGHLTYRARPPHLSSA